MTRRDAANHARICASAVVCVSPALLAPWWGKESIRCTYQLLFHLTLAKGKAMQSSHYNQNHMTKPGPLENNFKCFTARQWFWNCTYICRVLTSAWMHLLDGSSFPTLPSERASIKKKREGCDKENNLTAEDRGVIWVYLCGQIMTVWTPFRGAEAPNLYFSPLQTQLPSHLFCWRRERQNRTWKSNVYRLHLPSGACSDFCQELPSKAGILWQIILKWLYFAEVCSDSNLYTFPSKNLNKDYYVKQNYQVKQSPAFLQSVLYCRIVAVAFTFFCAVSHFPKFLQYFKTFLCENII